jgi:hypothetical protein
MAGGQSGEKIEAEGDSPIAALHGLARELRLLRRTMSG